MAKKKVFIGLTAYDSKLYVYTMHSIFNNIETLKAKGWEVALHVKMGDCYIEKVRNDIMHAFQKTDCTDLIFVDSDLQFDGDAMLKLLESPAQIIGGAYPYRSQDLEGFPVKIKTDEQGVPIGNVQLGLLECDFIPTGLMRVRRDALLKIKEKFPGDTNDKDEYQFFKTGIQFKEDGDHQWYGEDVYFCKICQKAGVIVWCYPKIGFAHIGQLNKFGNFHEWLLTHGKKE